jgi:hypothetical protein
VTKPERKDGPLPLQPQAMVTDSLACVVPALRFQESQQVGVNGIGLGRGHAVRKALVGFQCAILQQLCRQWS